MVPVVLLLLAQSASDPFTSTWLPLMTAVTAIGGLVFLAVRQRPEGESRLYADAMTMVAELKAQVAEEKQAREHLALRLVESQAERHELEQQVFKLYRRIEELEAKVGGRRGADSDV